jgi:beta-lactamase class A
MRVLLALVAIASGLAAETLASASDMRLQRTLEGILANLGVSECVRSQKIGVSIVDVSDSAHPRYAGVNDRTMLYAASLPKICMLVAGFEKIRAGQLAWNDWVRDVFTNMIRRSSNEDASRAIRMIGFDNIAKVLTSDKYQFYDPRLNGGLWIGKAYGGPSDYWQRDPIHNLSHGATSYQVARFYWMLERGELVDPAASAEIKEMLSKPAIHHKFVKGLDGRDDVAIFRKSGTWRHWHADSALIEHGSRKYIAVALMEDARGGDVLPKLIAKIDDAICGAKVSAGATGSVSRPVRRSPGAPPRS